MKKVALYVRVSTQEQAEEGYSIGAQIDRLTSYCAAKDWIVYDKYVDPGFSGSNTERPALKKMINDIKKGRIDLVLVYKLDRLSRSQKDTLLLIEDVFNPNGVAFVSINENFDTSTAFGRAMIGILSVFAQLEREQIKERSMMGRIERAKDGYFHGGGFTPIGYDYVDGNLVINEYEAMQVRKVFELFLLEKSLHYIRAYMHNHYTNKYGDWHSVSSIHSTLSQKIVNGKIEYRGEVYEGRHEAIIDDDTFEKAQQRYEKIRWNKKDAKHKKRPFQAKYLLIGLLECGNCGARYFTKGNYSGRGENRRYYPYYTCYSRGKTKKEFILDPDCKNKSYPIAELDEIIIKEIERIHYDNSYFNHIISQEKPEEEVDNSEIIEKRINEIDNQINRMLDLFQLGNMPMETISKRIEKLNDEKDSLLDQLFEEQKEDIKLPISEAKKLLSESDAVLKGDDLKKKRALVHSLIDKIILTDDKIEIIWSFC